MARRRTSAPTTTQAREIALSIRQGERRELTQREIGATLGINERTVRKIKSGQTPGTRTYARIMKAPRRPSAQPGLYNAEYVIGYDQAGSAIIGSHNVTVPQLRTASGGTRSATPLDVFRIRGLAGTIAADRAAQARRYGNLERMAPADSPIRLRKISRAYRATTTLSTMVL